MKPADPFAPFAGSFALGTLSTAGQAPFPGLVVPERRVLDLRTALEEPALTTRGILERWDEEAETYFVRKKDGSEVRVPVRGILFGKVVPG